LEKPFSIGAMVEADDGVIGIPHDQHFTGRVLPIPLPGPQVVHVVKVEVRQQR
jgi:hypothetical protein